MTMPSTPAALARIEEADQLVALVYVQLDRACQLVAAIRGGEDIYRATVALRDMAETLRRQLVWARRRDGMSLDSEPECDAVEKARGSK